MSKKINKNRSNVIRNEFPTKLAMTFGRNLLFQHDLI